MSVIKYSVIIPAYNAEKTICQCVKSLLIQNRDDIEIVVVNDGSSDSTDEILQSLEKEYSNIIYVSQNNSGVSKARNTGLDKASGKYVLFLDSDDSVSDDFFCSLDQMDTCEDSDMILFAHRLSIEGTDNLQRLEMLSKLTDSDTILEHILAGRELNPPWNKRYKRSVIEDSHLRFIEGMQIGEDLNFCLSYALLCKNIKAYPYIGYVLNTENSDSLSRKYRSDLAAQLETVNHSLAKSVQSSNKSSAEKERLSAIIDFLYIKNCFSSIAEECKIKKLNFLKDRQSIIKICRHFSTRLSGTYCNVFHRILRILLKYKCYWLFYLVAVTTKGRQFRKSYKEHNS